jgi:hypothetical protein
MVKIWTTEDKANDKIIAVVDNMIYKCNPGTEDIDEYVKALKMKDIPAKNTFGIPFSYIKEIKYQEGKKYIQVLFGNDGEEHFRITNEARLREVFEFFTGILPGSTQSKDVFKPLRAAKKPLIALLVVSILFVYTLFIANDIEHGEAYDVHGGHYGSMAGIVLMLAELGVKNVLYIYVPLIVIAILAFITKVRKPPVFHRIVIRR